MTSPPPLRQSKLKLSPHSVLSEKNNANTVGIYLITILVCSSKKLNRAPFLKYLFGLETPF